MSQPTNGQIRDDLSESEYRDHEGLGSTEIRKADKSVDALHHYQEEGVDETKEMRIGTALHAAVLEPHRFEREYIDSRPPSRPGDDDWKPKHHELAALRADGAGWDEVVEFHSSGYTRSTYEGYTDEEGWEDLKSHYESHNYDPDDDPLGEEAMERVLGMRDAVRNHPPVQGGMLSGGRTEVPFVWEERLSGRRDPVVGKGKADFVRREGDQLFVVDIKTTSKSASPGSYARTIGRRNYHMQAAWYSRGLEAATGCEVGHFVFLVVESKAPHHIKPILLGDETRRAGLERCLSAVDRIAEAREEDVYTGVDPRIEKVELKDWEK